jgi:hypothetical protein
MNIESWVVGFTDGEGSFSLTLGARPIHVPKPQFSIGLKTDDIEALEIVRDILGVGKIYHKGASTNVQGYTSKPISTLIINTKAECLKVVGFFEQNPPILKAQDFIIWSKAVRVWNTRDWRGRWTEEKEQASAIMRELMEELKLLHS